MVKRRWTAAFLSGALLFFLTACKGPDGVVATLHGEPVVTTEDVQTAMPFFYQAFHEGKKESTGSEESPEDLAARVANQLAEEKLVLSDTSLRTDIESVASEAWKKALERFGDEQGLISQLVSYGMTKEEFLASLRLSAAVEAHRKAYFEAFPVGAEELHSYYKKHKDEVSLLTFTEIRVPSRKEAVEIRDALEKDASSISEYESLLNGDGFEQTTFDRFVDVGRDAPVPDPEVFRLRVGESAFYYDEDSELYSVVLIEGRKDREEDVQEALRAACEEERYRQYLNRLAKDQDLRIDSDAIMEPSHESSD